MTGTPVDAPFDGEALLELRFPAVADRMKLIRRALDAAVRMCGFDEAEAGDIVLAVNEACQNVIRHGYRGDARGELRLGIYRRADGIAVRLADFAPPVDPSMIRPRDLECLRPGGLGSFFIREIMDSADYLPAPRGLGNLLQMTKRRTQST